MEAADVTLNVGKKELMKGCGLECLILGSVYATLVLMNGHRKICSNAT